MHPSQHTAIIREEALRLGFSHCGFSKAEFLEEEAPRLEQWLTQQRHGKMSYMERWFDKRLDPRLLVPGAKSVVSLLLNYFPEKQRQALPKISKYALGRDYHYTIKEKLKELTAVIRDRIGEVEGRAFVDSAPVLDRAWAKRAGLGWIGKNSNLINPKAGSFFFIAELIIDLETEPDVAITDYCGTCTRCLDACPTNAIIAPQIVDGSKCISYFTIELKESIPAEYAGKFGDWMFGCDVCQDVCPWNRFSKPHQEKDFEMIPDLDNTNAEDWLEMTEEIFGKIFSESPLQRPGLEALKRNVKFTLPPGGTPAG